MTPEMLPMVDHRQSGQGRAGDGGQAGDREAPCLDPESGRDGRAATDKTGTLTQNRVILERHVDIAGAQSPRVLEFACLNSFFQSGLRNLLDDAVLTHAELQAHIRSGAGYTKLDEVPFDFERRRMSVVVQSADRSTCYLICKGAVEEVFGGVHARGAGRRSRAADSQTVPASCRQ